MTGYPRLLPAVAAKFELVLAAVAGLGATVEWLVVGKSRWLVAEVVVGSSSSPGVVPVFAPTVVPSVRSAC